MVHECSTPNRFDELLEVKFYFDFIRNQLMSEGYTIKNCGQHWDIQ